jgi:flagellar motor switch protein FliG
MAALKTKNLREAAILLRSLPAVQRTRLLGKIEPRQVAVVTDEMNRLDQLGDDEQEAVLCEFAKANALPLVERSPTRPAPFQFLDDLQSKALIDLLAEEPPQAVALVLSYLPPQKAADVLAALTRDRQLEVVCRIAATQEVSPEVVGDVEEVLHRRLSRPKVIRSHHCGMAGVVRMLNAMAPPAERRLLDALAEADPSLIHAIRRAMFGADVAECEDWPLVEAAG